MFVYLLHISVVFLFFFFFLYYIVGQLIWWRLPCARFIATSASPGSSLKSCHFVYRAKDKQTSRWRQFTRLLLYSLSQRLVTPGLHLCINDIPSSLMSSADSPRPLPCNKTSPKQNLIFAQQHRKEQTLLSFQNFT